MCNELMPATADFQKRAPEYEHNSRWVTSDSINNVPYTYLCLRKSLGRLLDAGGGTGYLSWFLSSKLPSDSITILDASSNMLLQAKERLPYARTVCDSLESFCLSSSEKYDTVLARQILHYVDDVDLALSCLRKMLKKEGVIYIGQFVVQDSASDDWHMALIQRISKSRKRSFVQAELIRQCEKSGFKVLNSCCTDYEENLMDFFKRRMNEETEYSALLDASKKSLNRQVISSLSIRTTNNNLFFTVQFCHLLLGY